MDAAYGRIAQSVNVPGFRKGKVPARVIEQRFGRGAVLEEAVNDALPEGVRRGAARQQHRARRPPGDRRDRAGGRPVADLHRRGRGAPRVRPARLLSPHGHGLERDPGRGRRRRAARQPAWPVRHPEGRRPRRRRRRRPAGRHRRRHRRGRRRSRTSSATRCPTSSAPTACCRASTTPCAAPPRTRCAPSSSPPRTATGRASPLVVTATVKAVRERELPALDDDFAQLASEFDTVDELRADVRERLDPGQAARAGCRGPQQRAAGAARLDRHPAARGRDRGRGRGALRGRARQRRRAPRRGRAADPRVAQEPVRARQDRREGGGLRRRDRALRVADPAGPPLRHEPRRVRQGARRGRPGADGDPGHPSRQGAGGRARVRHGRRRRRQPGRPEGPRRGDEPPRMQAMQAHAREA